MTQTWDNRVKFVVRFLYDIDNNGFLDKNDFDCLALRSTVIEGKGEFNKTKYEENLKVMRNLWNEISDLADFNKDGVVTTDEFKGAVKNACVGKKYAEFPQAMKMFIDSNFATIDINADGVVGVEEFRVDCVSRMAYKVIEEIDTAFDKLLNDDDRKKGGITLSRYQELYAEFIGNPEEKAQGAYLFGPLPELV